MHLHLFLLYFDLIASIFNRITFFFDAFTSTLQQKQNLKRIKNMIEHFIFLFVLALAYPIVDKFTDKFDK